MHSRNNKETYHQPVTQRDSLTKTLRNKFVLPVVMVEGSKVTLDVKTGLVDVDVVVVVVVTLAILVARLDVCHLCLISLSIVGTPLRRVVVAVVASDARILELRVTTVVL